MHFSKHDCMLLNPVIVKNCEGAEIFNLPFACHTDAGRRLKTPGSETKDFITYGTASSMRFMFMLVSSCHPQVHRGKTEGPM